MKSTFVKGFIMQKKKANCEICLQMKCIAICFRIGINSSAKKNLNKFNEGWKGKFADFLSSLILKQGFRYMAYFLHCFPTFLDQNIGCGSNIIFWLRKKNIMLARGLVLCFL